MEERMQIMRNVGQNRDSLVDRLSGSMVWGSGFSPTGKQSTHTHTFVIQATGADANGFASSEATSCT